MSSVNVFYFDNRTEFTGNLDPLNKPKVKHWLRNNFELDYTNPNKIVLINEQFKDKQYLFNFKNSIQKKMKSIDFIFDTAFNNVIAEEIKNQENFVEFSNNARSIWENSYDTKEFKEFCDVIEVKLSKRRLYKLQVLSGYHMSYSQNSCNFSVPGAGKTSIVYSAYAYLNNLNKTDDKYVNKLLIIGPPSSFGPWEQEYQECFGRFPKSFRINGEVSVSVKKEILKGITPNEYELYLITYQSVPTLIDELMIFLKSESNKVMLVCDEAHKFKGLSGIWASNILSLANWAKSRIILTGTPVPNGYEDLYNIFKFIYPERNIAGFRPDFLKGLTQNPVQSNIDQLIENIKPFFVRIKKSDLNLPPFIDHPIICNQLSSLESEVYDRLEATISNSDSEVNRQSIHFRMIQCCNNLNLLNKSLLSFQEENFELVDSRILLESLLGNSLSQKVRDIGSEYIPSKHILVKDLVMKIALNKGKVILWGIFIDSIKRLHKYLESCGLKGAYIIGETRKTSNDGNYEEEITRENIINKFKNSDLDYIISNPIVLGESISLHKICHNAIYFEQWYAAAPYVQSRDRIHRVWLDQNMNQVSYETNYFHILSNRRADSDIHNRVQSKFRRMMEIIEQDIPFFEENIENERTILINSIIDDYRSR
ncbi:DEAD/DEAH box helicase [Flavobacterium collinsii]|uniref:Helicase SNF2 n=1 Tax=Flavobacterium collinsii TaxID=1114861 RepID=A0A9W4TE30_9FLAO|nr:DEAD/DEAH box helicase [Flavobacterium collinsii]CAI2766322.1 Helicase SNF2 [Flavobacterium collinsii]